MSGGMERHRDVTEPDLLAIGDGLHGAREVLAIAQPHHVERFPGREHRAVTRPGVVGMAMRDQGPLDRPDRIDMEAAGLAAKPSRDGHQDVLRAHADHIGIDSAISNRHARA